jgi:hypothetical protein
MGHLRRGPSSPQKINSRQPVWDLYRDGLTRSLIAKWMVCPERFRLYTVEGLAEDRGFDAAIGYGDLWHAAEEAKAKGGHPFVAIREEADRQSARYPLDHDQIAKWVALCDAQFRVYLKYWEKSEGKRTLIEGEKSFRYLLKLDDGRVIPIRGKRDSVFGRKAGGRKLVVLQENKTKGRVDDIGIARSLDLDLQTMMYVDSLYAEGIKPDEVLYNVIRRPLADGRRQKKGETYKAFIERVTSEHPKGQFWRWVYQITEREMETFRRRVLHPILTTIADWWDGFNGDPFNPWNNPRHFIRPFGVYDPLAEGLPGAYFGYMTSGSRAGLTRVDTVFPELEDGSKNQQSVRRRSQEEVESGLAKAVAKIRK